MNGRTLFNRFGPLIRTICLLFAILPKRFRKWLLCINRNTGGDVGVFIRYVLVSHLARSCGNNVIIKQYVILENIENIDFGNNVSIHPFCYLEGKGGIFIGNDVSIAHGTSVLSTNHTWERRDIPIKYNPVSVKMVVIRDDVWVGCGCRILSGVEIGERSVVAAGAIVNRNVEQYELVGGIPAKHLKYI